MFRLLVGVVVGVCAFALWAPAAHAQGTPVTVTILRFMEVQDPDPVAVVDAIDNPDVIGDGDYYAEVRIGSVPFERNRSDFTESEDFHPFWSFARSVDDSATIPIVIRMWDADLNENNDDIIDINPQDNVQELVLTLDLASCTWSGDVDSPQMFAQGDGDHEHFGDFEGGEAGKILFDVACSQSGDIDGDGIPDGVERFGVRDSDGDLVMDMALLGADPCRLNIAVEIDFMSGASDGHTHRPSNLAITEILDAFNGAGFLVSTLSPSSCPYAGFPTQTGGGIGMLLVVDDPIAEQPLTSCPDMESIRDDNFAPELAPYFHYNLWAHNYSVTGSSTTSSGNSCANSGKDFIVSLGSFMGPDSTMNTQNGTDRQQSGTFMHELGHNLGLTHGGGFEIDVDQDGNPVIRNCKPNYLSVMNYLFQTKGLTNADTGVQAIDYSRADLPTLDEERLDEQAGIGDGALLTTWAGPTGALAPVDRGDGPLDWDNDTLITFGDTVEVDLTAVAFTRGCGRDWNNPPMQTPTPGDQLRGWNDWENLEFRAVMAPMAGAPIPVVEEEMTPEMVEEIEEFWESQLRCSPPGAGDWVVARDCTIWRDVTAPGDLIVETGVVLQVGSGVTLNIDFALSALRIAPGARLEVQPGARIE
jgi:hypothetical protein